MPITPEQLASSGREDGEQKALFCWAALNVVNYPELKYLFHIPNGGFRNKAEAANFVAKGVKKGVPDIFLPVGRDEWFGLFIELKKIKGGVTSKEQDDWIEFLRSQGYGAMVCKGWEEARNAIVQYLTYYT